MTRLAGTSALQERLDDAYRVIADQRRPVAEVCAEVVPFVTPGLRLSFDGAKDNGDGTFSVETTSDKPFTLTIEAPPNAPRKALFSAICLDCGGTLPRPPTK